MDKLKKDLRDGEVTTNHVFWGREYEVYALKRILRASYHIDIK